MSTLAEIETAIKQLSPNERARLARWWRENFDSDDGLELDEEVAMELDLAQEEIKRGDVASWAQIKRSSKAGDR